MAENSTTTVPLEPLFFGRVTRVVFGAVSALWGVLLWNSDFPSLAVSLVVIFLGVSFLVGGLMANPGLVLPAGKRVHSF